MTRTTMVADWPVNNRTVAFSRAERDNQETLSYCCVR